MDIDDDPCGGPEFSDANLTPVFSCLGIIGCILSIIFPPLGVLVMFGCRTIGCCYFCICLVLTVLGYLPGIIFAIWMIVTSSPRY